MGEIYENEVIKTKSYDTSFITAAGVGSDDWMYVSGAPFAYHIDGTVWPFTLWGYVGNPNETGEAIKSGLLEYVDYYGVLGESIVFKEGPSYTVKGYKMAFVRNPGDYTDKTGGEYALWGYDGTEIRELSYADIEIVNHPTDICTRAHHNATAIGVWTPESGAMELDTSKIIAFTLGNDFLDPLDSENQMIGSIPIFLDNQGDLEGYLQSPDPDPTHFGGYFAEFSWREEGEGPETDDPGPGDVIDGTFTDLGMDLGHGPMRAFICSDEALENLATKISKGWFESKIGDAIISLKLIKTPGAVECLTEDDQVIIPAGVNTPSVDGKYVRHQFQAFDFGTLQIPEHFGNFVDYAGTVVSLYLPYSGVHTLDTKTVINSNGLSLSCGVDYVSGSVIWYVNVDRQGVNQVLYEFTGNISMDQPLEALNMRIMSQTLSGIMTTATGFVSNNAMQVAVGMKETFDSLGNLQPIQIGNVSSNFGWTGIQYPFLIFQRNKIVYPDGFAAVKGRPSQKVERLSSLTGYTKVAAMHLDGIDALEEEKADLLERLKNGVIL